MAFTYYFSNSGLDATSSSGPRLAVLSGMDTLIEQATKEEIAEVARVLALHVAHCRQRYGDVSIEESLEPLRTERVSDEMAKTLADGFGVLVEVLKALGTPKGEH